MKKVFNWRTDMMPHTCDLKPWEVEEGSQDSWTSLSYIAILGWEPTPSEMKQQQQRVKSQYLNTCVFVWLVCVCVVCGMCVWCMCMWYGVCGGGMGVCVVYVYVLLCVCGVRVVCCLHVCLWTWCLERSEEDIRSPLPRITVARQHLGTENCSQILWDSNQRS